MPQRYLRTTDIAYAVAVHPNTVRQYEIWGLLPPVPRSPAGYRLFSETHLDQMRLARTVMAFTWLGGEIRHAGYAMIQQAAVGNLGGALEHAYQTLVLVQSERAQAEVAASLLDRWAHGTVTDATIRPMRIGETARYLHVTADMLRNWERNGLIRIPRDPQNGYRVYGSDELGRLRVIRVLRRSGYSMMAILRMLVQLDKGHRNGLRLALDTPGSDEDIGHATDQWLSTLADIEPRVEDTIAQLEMMLRKHAVKGSMGPDKSTQPQGRAIVIQQFTSILEDALDCFVPLIPTQQVRLQGAVVGLLQGVFQPVRDISLVVKTATQVDDFAQAMRIYPQVEKPHWVKSEKIYRAAHLIRGVEVSMAMVEALQETSESGMNIPSPWNYYTNLIIGVHSVPAEALELGLATELANDDPRHYAPLIRHMHKHGGDVELAQRAMEANAIPRDRMMDVLLQLRTSS